MRHRHGTSWLWLRDGLARRVGQECVDRVAVRRNLDDPGQELIAGESCGNPVLAARLGRDEEANRLHRFIYVLFAFRERGDEPATKARLSGLFLAPDEVFVGWHERVVCRPRRWLPLYGFSVQCCLDHSAIRFRAHKLSSCSMRVERLFKVLVLGGAALGGACGNEATPEGGTNEPGSGNGGADSPGPTSQGGSSGSSAAGAGGTSTGGMAGTDAAGAADSGGAGKGSAGSTSEGGTSSAGSSPGGAAGMAGSSVELECRVDAAGQGDPADPCGCPCCWARDCPNTDDCCGAFCSLGDDGRGCCAE